MTRKIMMRLKRKYKKKKLLMNIKKKVSGLMSKMMIIHKLLIKMDKIKTILINKNTNSKK